MKIKKGNGIWNERIASVISGILLLVVILITATQALCYWIPNWWRNEYAKYNTPQYVTGETSLDDAVYITEQMLDYCIGRIDTLDDTEELRQLVVSCLDIDPENVVRTKPSTANITGDYAADLAQAEHEILTAYLNRHNGSMTELARQLGISRTTLYNKLKDKTDH